MLRLTLMLAWIIPALAGCCTRPASSVSSPLADLLATAIVTPIAEALSQAPDVSYATKAFHRKNGRWPASHAELSDFVEGSDGYLRLPKFDTMTFVPWVNGGVEIVAVRQSSTNRIYCGAQGLGE